MRVFGLILSAGFVLLLAGCSQGSSVIPLRDARSFNAIASSDLTTDGVKLRFFPTPSQISWPDYVTKGSDGNIWFSEFYYRQVGRITPAGKITEFPLPGTTDIEGIAAGPDGNLWFTAPGAGQIGRVTTKGVVKVFHIKTADPSPRGITAGPDGNVWFCEFYSNKIGRITPSGEITDFTIPQPQSSPWWITTGKDGDLWFTESGSALVGRFDPRTLKFAAPIHVAGRFPTPWGIMTAPDGNIWFTERVAGDISIILNGAVKSFHIEDKTSYPDTMVADPSGIIWFTENQAHTVGRFNPATQSFLPPIRLPNGDIPTGITLGADGNIWFAVDNYDQPNSIGEFVLH